MNDLIDFISIHRHDLLEKTWEHTWLTFVALAIAAVIGIGLGIWISRQKKYSGAVLGVANVFQTIPSLALLGFLLPVLGIGWAPAIVALFLYALLPIIRNTFAGITEVDPAITEAAKGMGLTDRQRLIKVELPLAIPVIFAGLRTATVINVGIATLCALIGAGGLGEFIFQGIALNNPQMILTGAIPAALLALFFDFVLGQIQNNISRIVKPVLIGFAIICTGIIISLPFTLASDTEFLAGFPPEFQQRPDGYPGLKTAYDIEFETVEISPGLMYQAIKNKKVDIISGYSSDGRIDVFDLKVLEDDQSFFPPYFAAASLNGETLRKYPELEGILNQLAGKINDEGMRQLNYQADFKKIPTSVIAKEYLEGLGLKTEKVRNGSPDLIIGTKQFTEQFILADMFVRLIENYSMLDVEVKYGLGGTKICYDALKEGEIDLYPEYTGTSFLLLLKVDDTIRDSLIRDPEEVYEFVKRESSKRDDITWLKPLGFNNTYALMMRKAHAEKYSIESISDLKRELNGGN